MSAAAPVYPSYRAPSKARSALRNDPNQQTLLSLAGLSVGDTSKILQADLKSRGDQPCSTFKPTQQ